MTAPGIEPGKAERHQPQSFFSFKRRQSSVPLFCAFTFHLSDSPVAGSFTSGHVHLVRLDVRQLVSLIRPQGPQPLAGVAVRPLDKAVLLMRSLGIGTLVPSPGLAPGQQCKLQYKEIKMKPWSHPYAVLLSKFYINLFKNKYTKSFKLLD